MFWPANTAMIRPMRSVMDGRIVKKPDRKLITGNSGTVRDGRGSKAVNHNGYVTTTRTSRKAAQILAKIHDSEDAQDAESSFICGFLVVMVTPVRGFCGLLLLV